MQPQQLRPLDEATLERNAAEEQEVMKRIQFILNKADCVLVAETILRDGMVQHRIGISKLHPDVVKEMKKAKARGEQPVSGFNQPS